MVPSRLYNKCWATYLIFKSLSKPVKLYINVLPYKVCIGAETNPSFLVYHEFESVPKKYKSFTIKNKAQIECQQNIEVVSYPFNLKDRPILKIKKKVTIRIKIEETNSGKLYISTATNL